MQTKSKHSVALWIVRWLFHIVRKDILAFMNIHETLAARTQQEVNVLIKLASHSNKAVLPAKSMVTWLLRDVQDNCAVNGKERLISR